MTGTLIPHEIHSAETLPPERGGLTSATYERGVHMPALDGVRGLAIALILLHTFGGIATEGHGAAVDALRAVAMAGWTGVELFFVLSGFLITGILVDSRSVHGTKGFFRRFYLRRTLRIFPLYYAVLAFWLLVLPLTHLAPALALQARAHGAWYWLYLSNWVNPFGIGVDGLAHFWSLAVEEQFYLLWPLAVALLARRQLGALCAALIALTPLVRLALIAGGAPVLAPYEFLVARWDALAVGALLAFAIREQRKRAALVRHLPRLTIAVTVASIVLAWLAGSFGPSVPAISILGQSLVAMLSAALVATAAGIDIPADARVAHALDRTRRLFSTRIPRFLGKYSYGIYVFHLPIHFVVSWRMSRIVNEASWGTPLLRLALYITLGSAASIAAALVSWRVLEAPALRLKERLAPR